MSYLACTNKAEVRTSPLFPVTRVYLLFRACLNFRSNVTLNGHKYLNSKNYLKLCCKYNNLQNKSQVFFKKLLKNFLPALIGFEPTTLGPRRPMLYQLSYRGIYLSQKLRIELPLMLVHSRNVKKTAITI